ncbi:uncharacterized protein (TIGR02647 family) [Tamilnaduibacter salinus]|uniref:TIGR02647 family protein n=1 Tax=Tamilnaduibacter salinus TaxID=1484056 RepID=A0A2A2I2L6_9GAMM|nr:TIGR02647 family protein [Tamilnaduibacter salinus]PAV25832.1 TIGR02647 family protein [Tamilnaduibacter salinus]PVY75814.1 uncharacterized protein (TIGR02647 family) [Tamilnaduibacter salinus]
MAFTPSLLDELNLLVQFRDATALEGIKVHQHSASPEMVDAAERLYGKGLITQKDGGYLTTLGIEAVDQAHKLLAILSTQ